MRNENTQAAEYISLVDELTATHAVIVDQFLPRIEHYLSGLEGVQGVHGQKASVCRYWFGRFAGDLREHFAFEEREVFPVVQGGQKQLTVQAKAFIQAHEKHELRLQLLLSVLQEELNFLAGDLAYELSLGRLKELKDLLHEHAQIEEAIFADLIS